jgi:hypothetical protein
MNWRHECDMLTVVLGMTVWKVLHPVVTMRNRRLEQRLRRDPLTDVEAFVATTASEASVVSRWALRSTVEDALRDRRGSVAVGIRAGVLDLLLADADEILDTRRADPQIARVWARLRSDVLREAESLDLDRTARAARARVRGGAG